MTTPRDEIHQADDRRLEHQVARLLFWGVTIAAVLAVVGGVMLLLRNGGVHADYRVFTPAADQLRSVHGVWRAALAGDPAAIVQLGLIVLIATPISRVAVTVIAFARRRDKALTAVTCVVLCLLLGSLL